jgi:hypothetical protein
MMFKQSSYNVQMDVLVPSNYPLCAPIIFVLETSSVVIKPNHPHVGPNGMVHLSYRPRPERDSIFFAANDVQSRYLHSWCDRSSVSSCFDELFSVFQQQPFVYIPPALQLYQAPSAQPMCCLQDPAGVSRRITGCPDPTCTPRASATSDHRIFHGMAGRGQLRVP